LGQPADLATVRTHNAVDDAVQSYTANSLLRRNGRSAAFGSRAVNGSEVSTPAIWRRRLVELAFVFSCDAATRSAKGAIWLAPNSTSRGLRAAFAEDPLAAFHRPQDASSAQIEMHRQFLISERAEQDAKLSEIGRQQSQKEAERATTSANVAKIQATIPVLQERVDIQSTYIRRSSTRDWLRRSSISPNCRIWSASSRISSCNRAGSAHPMRPLPC
jgi:hypothetical protein